MRKLISAALTGILLTGFGVGLSGCSDETSTKTQTTTTTPGGKVTETETKSVKQSGQNPPAPTKTTP
jgi:hypothetical protein